MTAIAVILMLLGGGGYAIVPEDNPVYEVLDQRYWTIMQQNIEVEFAIEDELMQLDEDIARKLENGEEVHTELRRKAVLEDRLRRLRKEP